MAQRLPAMVYSDGIKKHSQVSFGGYDHNLSAGDGGIWDMENMRSDLYPLLSPRAARYKLWQGEGVAAGFYMQGGHTFVGCGGVIYRDGVNVGSCGDKVSFVGFGDVVIALENQQYYDEDAAAFKDINAKVTVAAKIQDGTFVGESAAANTIYADVNWADYFNEGDAVEISGAATHTENNTTIIIREIDGNYLRFYENSFTIASGGDSETLTISRQMPELEFAFANENRLWGCKGNTIYASKLGDFKNWNVFDGVATDSYAVDVNSSGDFTGAIAYLGYPCFFKENSIYKMYGDKPSTYQVLESASLGVEKGSGASLAIAGEVLFYLSRVGVVAYSGGIPQNVAAAFGTKRYKNAVAGSDGKKYYISMLDGDGAWNLFVYDTQKSMWHREDETQVVGFGWDDEFCFLDADGTVWMGGNIRTVPDGEKEETIFSMVEWGDFIESDPNKKGVSKLQLRMELDEGATFNLYIQYDSNGEWVLVKQLQAARKRSYYLPVVPMRCDHFRLRVEAVGEWRLYSLVRESYSGSEM